MRGHSLAELLLQVRGDLALREHRGVALELAIRSLPSLALGSTALLHALRAGALFTIGFAVATVLARRGRPPSDAAVDTGIGYGAEETRETAAALAELQREVDRQQALLDRLAEQLDALGSKP